MTPATTTQLKTELLARRARFLEQLAQLRGGDIGRAEASAEHFGQKLDSTAQEATAREIEYALDEHESAELGQVDAALRRMDSGSYGQCVDCGVEIPLARLYVVPEAARCIRCQEAAE